MSSRPPGGSLERGDYMKTIHLGPGSRIEYWHCQNTLASIGVLLGLAVWRCVDQMLIVTNKSERASVTQVRKEIRRNAVSLV